MIFGVAKKFAELGIIHGFVSTKERKIKPLKIFWLLFNFFRSLTTKTIESEVKKTEFRDTLL